MNLQRLALLACAALLLGCTRQTSAPASTATTDPTGTASTTVNPSSSNALPTPTGTPAATTYVEVATGKTSTTPPSAEFPPPGATTAPREADKAGLPPGTVRAVADPSGRFVAYAVGDANGRPAAWQGWVRDTATGKEWKVEEPLANCYCDSSSVASGPIWSSTGRFVAFGTGNFRDPKQRHVVVIEPGANRVTELAQPAWMRLALGDEPDLAWRPGYDVLALEQMDGVYLYDAVARTSTHMSVGIWPRFVSRDLVQVVLLGRDNRPEETAFTDIWRGGEVARVPVLLPTPLPAVQEVNGRWALAAEATTPNCAGVIVIHPALRSSWICIPGANAPTWSPDGRMLAYSRVDGASSRSVVLFDPATSSEQPIVDHLPVLGGGQKYRATWSADGRHLRLDRVSIGFGG